jgi:hypothetical protein
MKKSIAQIRHDIDHRVGNFKKSEESAPVGYKFLCNYNLANENEDTRTDFRTIQWYKDNGYLVLPVAYNMYGEVIDNDVAIYKKL